MSIKRYEAHTNIDDFKSDWRESKDGSMVKYEDYAALEQQLAAVVAENAGLKNALEWLYETVSSEIVPVPDEKYSSVTNAAQVLSETPATDAYLAEVRAQGVEMFASSLKVLGQHEHPYSTAAKVFAAQLRQGAAL